VAAGQGIQIRFGLSFLAGRGEASDGTRRLILWTLDTHGSVSITKT
jgi:hypothetical protein